MLREKHHTRYIFVSFICITAFLIYPINSIAASLYNITDIGPLKLTGYDNQNLKIKINDNNEVIGWHRESSFNTSPVIGFSWNNVNGFQIPLNTSFENSFIDNNTSDITVGFTYDSSGNQIASTWDATYSSQTTLNSLGGNSSQANAINSSNRVAGNSEDNNGITQPVYWNNNVLTIVPINNPNGGSADTINDNNWVAGSIYDNQYQAYVWDGIEINLLNTSNTDIAMSWASDINNLNQLVGGMQFFQTPGSTNQRILRTQAYSWDKTNGLTNLGQNIIGSSWATSINGDQQIVGGRTINVLDRKAILWENTTAFDLNNIILDIGNWELEDATDININGNIVGIGKRSGLYHAFLLEPSGGTVTTSDLEISLATNNANTKTRSLHTNEDQVLNFNITNHGPDNASNVSFESTLDALLSITNFSIDKGECKITNKLINCDIPSLVLNESVALSLELNTDVPNDYHFEAKVEANEIDAGINKNNSISKTIKVISQTPIQSSPTPTPAQSSSTDESSDAPETSDENNSAPNPQVNVSSSTGGCSLGHNHTPDPLLYLLLVVSILKIIRSKPHKTRDI